MLISSTSCYQLHGVHSSGRSDLYAVACYSVPFVTGNPNFDAVKVIEKDKYGRVLFKYTSFTHALDDFNGDHVCALLICQKSDKEYAYYYENYSFIISTGDDTFADSEIQRLKELNDWDKELVQAKMSKVMNRFGPYGNLMFFDDDESVAAVKNYLEPQKSARYFSDIISMDADNKIFYVLREYAKSNNGYSYFKAYFVISDKNFNIESDTSIMIIDDIINCQANMQSFKEQNNWQSLK